MDRGLIDQALALLDEQAAPSPAEWDARARLVGRLFATYGARDDHLAQVYVEETAAIPLRLFVLAVRAVIRERVYPDLPTLGTLWRAARSIAGMDRERYRAGRYLPPERAWPPDGKRYGVCAGELEDLPALIPRAWLPQPEAVGLIEAPDDAA